jgi:phosphate transport system protein
MMEQVRLGKVVNVVQEIRHQYQSLLRGLQEDFLEIISMVSKAFYGALFALKTGNHFQAEQVIQRDKFVNARCYELEDSALNVLTLQQPVIARDLRYVASMLQFSSELERMGDYAKGIAQIALDLYAEKQLSEQELLIVHYLEEMNKVALKQLEDVGDAFINRDLAAARQIAKKDDDLDSRYNDCNLKIISMLFNDQSLVQRAMRLNWAAHNIERLGDRVVNICERIVFIENGELADF